MAERRRAERGAGGLRRRGVCAGENARAGWFRGHQVLRRAGVLQTRQQTRREERRVVHRGHVAHHPRRNAPRV